MGETNGVQRTEHTKESRRRSQADWTKLDAVPRCPKCDEDPYRLADGRLKCRACGKRFAAGAPKSLWDNSRLAAADRERLLDMVVDGEPSNAEQLRDIASANTREQFARVVRACCAHDQGLLRPFPILQAPARAAVSSAPRELVHTEPQGVVVSHVAVVRGKVTVRPVVSGPDERRWRDAAPSLPLHRLDEDHAYVSLEVSRDRVILPRERHPRRLRRAVKHVDDFWGYFYNRLDRFGRVPVEYFHLYVVEACFRFNCPRRPAARERLAALMQRLTMDDIGPVIAGTAQGREGRDFRV